jgi:membrane protein YdbS with pleckstrin-like domain
MALDHPDAPDMTNWSEVEQHWGFVEEDRPRLIRAYKNQQWIALIPLLLVGLVVLGQVLTFGFPTLNSLLVSFLLLALASVIFIISSWRVWMFENKKFQPLTTWLGVKNDEKYF